MSEEKKPKENQKIKCEGPIDSMNGASFYRFQKKEAVIDIFPGQILKVGEDITASEAKELLEGITWKFSEVN